jgi:hypothetical protein
MHDDLNSWPFSDAVWIITTAAPARSTQGPNSEYNDYELIKGAKRVAGGLFLWFLRRFGALVDLHGGMINRRGGIVFPPRPLELLPV